MKKVLFTLVFFALTITTFAQTSAGSKFIGGTFNIVSYTEQQGLGQQDYKSSGFNLAPSFGYFVVDNITLGLSLNISSEKTDDQGFETRYSDLLVGPFARIYKFTSNENFAFYAQGSLLFGSNKVKPEGSPESSGSTFTFSLSPGVAYFFNEKWALDFSLQGIVYRSVDPNKNANNDKDTTFIFGASSLSPSLGFRFFF